MSRENVTRRISIYVNGQEVENSLRGVDGAIAQVRNRLRLLNTDSQTYDQDSRELIQTMTQLRERQSQYREELGLTNTTMNQSTELAGGLRNTLTGIWDSLLSGDLEGAKEGLTSLQAGMGGLVKSALAFIATPIGAAIAVLSGIAVGTKALFDFNAEADKGAQLIEKLSGKTGQAVEEIRVNIQGLVDTFGVEFDALASAVDNLVDTGVAKNELEALDQIKNGLLTAPDANEFLSSLENTAVVSKQLGLDLADVIALKQQIEATGVNPEAVFGALAKATNNLKLQTDGLREKLIGAFGNAFTDDILAKVKTGQITTVQALDAIGKKSVEVGLNQTQQAQIGKELFGKAAIAAGGYASVLDTVVQAQKKQGQELTGTQKAMNDLAAANTKLNQAQSELFRVKDFGEIWTGIKAKAIDFFASAISYISDLKKGIQPLIDLVSVGFSAAWAYLKTIVVSTFDVIGGVLKVFSTAISTLVGFVYKLFQGDFSGAINLLKNGFIGLGNIVSDTFGKIKNNVINGIKSIVDSVAPLLKAIGLDVDFIQKKLESFKSKKVEITTTEKKDGNTNTNEKTNTKALKEELQKQQQLRDEAAAKESEKRKAAADKKKQDQEKAAKEENDRIIGLAKAQADVAKAELNQFIANNKSKLDANGQFTTDALDQESLRLQAIADKQKDALAAERLAKVAELDAKKTSDEEYTAAKLAIDTDYDAKRIELDNQTNEQIAANKTAFDEQQKQLKAEQILADNELALAEAATKEEEDRTRENQQYQSSLDALNLRLEKGKITEEQYRSLRAKAESDHSKAMIAISRAERDVKLNAMGELFGGIAKLLGENTEAGKIAALAEVAISQGLAIARIWEAKPIGPAPFDVAAKIGGTAVAIANVVAAAAKINSVKTPKFFYGGATGTNPALGFDQFGPVTGYVHQNEYVIPEVMTQDPHFANTITWLEANRQQKIRGYAEGGATSPNVLGANSVTAQDNTAQMNQLLQAVLNRLDNPVAPKLAIGYKEVRDINEMNDELSSSKTNGKIG